MAPAGARAARGDGGDGLVARAPVVCRVVSQLFTELVEPELAPDAGDASAAKRKKRDAAREMAATASSALGAGGGDADDAGATAEDDARFATGPSPSPSDGYV